MDSDKGIINLFVSNGTGKSLYKLIKIIQEKCIEFEKKRHFISGYFPTDRSRTIKSHVDCILSNGFLLAALVEMTGGEVVVTGEVPVHELGWATVAGSAGLLDGRGGMFSRMMKVP